MSDPQDRQSTEDSGQDRRRERRLVFTRQCAISINAPVWTITNQPLLGVTENITSVGLRVGQLRTNPGQSYAWQDAINRDFEVVVEVSLPELPTFPRLKGSIVWVQENEGDASHGDPITTSVGILFSILREHEARALKKIVHLLATQSGS